MLSFRASLAFLLSAAIVAVPALATTTHKKPTSSHNRASSTHLARTSSKSKKATSKSRHQKLHGQQAIAPERVTEIQKALIREHYFNGEANGQWDSTTVAAMQKFQADQGWQTKLMPDSRAIKKLGLGPDYSNAINASGSSFADPKPADGIPASQASGFAAASGVNR